MLACLLFCIFGNSPRETIVLWREEPMVPSSELGLPQKLATLRHTFSLIGPSNQESCFFPQQSDKHNSASWALSFSLLWADREQVPPPIPVSSPPCVSWPMSSWTFNPRPVLAARVYHKFLMANPSESSPQSMPNETKSITL